ncbi:endonuclease NucS domain-containing protein [Peribacillus simplex]|uniref:endonuclease NucS domain-containing protein n=1 Tax=Peribacillus simplex TaxID=1478 RepID=UPI000BA605AD|nr:endonuclease NucS domain-containing protein [Peribacillus simplex]PAK42645.1 hypothetical protein CHI08_08765 [Peribacillus simplex]
MYRLDAVNNRLEEIQETTFSENDLKERQHIEEWIRKSPDVLGEDLLIIAHEYDKFEVNERLDLLAVDKEGNLVIIEVKRDATGSNVDFQALKYASYCARLSPNDILETYEEYVKVNSAVTNAKDELMEFLEVEIEEELNNILNNSQRIIIVGKDIDKRILSVCTWLYENSIDIKCVTIKPYKLEGQIILDTNQIIPPYKLEDYYINKKTTAKERKISIDQDVSTFLQEISNFVNTKTEYTARYGGKRDYFVGHQFLNIPWKFVFVYKKDRTASVFIESYKKEGTDLIRSIASNHLEELRVLLGCEVELIRGSRNTDLYKLVAKLTFSEHQSFDECVSQYTNTFVKYQQFLKAKVRHS